MDCDTGQDLHGTPFSLLPDGPLKQYSLLQNVCSTYGLTMKEEDDLASYVKDNGGFLSYDDSLMVDTVCSAVDPLPFNATITFASSPENFLDHLSENTVENLIRDVSILSFFLYLVHSYFTFLTNFTISSKQVCTESVR